MANHNIIKTKAPVSANKYIKNKVNGSVKTTIKLAANRNTKIRIKKS